MHFKYHKEFLLLFYIVDVYICPYICAFYCSLFVSAFPNCLKNVLQYFLMCEYDDDRVSIFCMKMLFYFIFEQNICWVKNSSLAVSFSIFKLFLVLYFLEHINYNLILSDNFIVLISYGSVFIICCFSWFLLFLSMSGCLCQSARHCIKLCRDYLNF